ncbi:hypothetical protein [Photobacterium kishitanii]|uniref:hypothetical protein n=1 Tax=Photobacterium kishitanii TaxID=318456 RepID=UPI0011B27FF6|nr:hypothetical protein [Photobacterium kishitanii]
MLKEKLIKQWKYLALLVVIITTSMVMISYSSIVKDKWVSDTILAQPYYTEILVLDNIIDELKTVNENVDIEDINSESIFKQYVEMLNSYDVKSEYLNTLGFNDVNGSLIDGVFKLNNTPDNTLIEIKYTSNSGKKSFKELTGYINFTKDKLNKRYEKILLSYKKAIFNNLQIKKAIKVKYSKEKLLNEIKLLKMSSQVAGSAGVNNPIINPGVTMSLPISLGSKVLISQLNAFEKNEFNPYLDSSSIDAKISILNDINIDEVNFTPYHIIKSASIPKYKSSPSHFKFMLLGVILSLILSMVILYLQIIWEEKNDK